MTDGDGRGRISHEIPEQVTKNVLFSQRHGYKPATKAVQFECMDEELKTGLWNVFLEQAFRELFGPGVDGWKSLWVDFWKKPVDEMPALAGRYTGPYGAQEWAKSWFFDVSWSDVLDFIGFVALQLPGRHAQGFVDECNRVLEREASAYRFVGNIITPMTDQTERENLETALSDENPCPSARIHLRCALEKYSDRKHPDYRNSMKESISAVEAVAQCIAGDPSASLSKALAIAETKLGGTLHKALKKAYGNLYDYTSDADGIRHAMSDEPNLFSEDAYYMLVSCSAFVNYLIAKAQKAGLPLS